MTINLWVAIPVFNETKALPKTLERLHDLSKTDDFNVVLCDNNSTDGSKELIETFIKDNSLNWLVVEEQEKGTGAAADTAIRTAINAGATHVARTDADCLPAHDWIQVIKAHFENTPLRMLAGRITARMDDTNITKKDAQKFNLVVPVAAWFGKIRPLNKGKQFKGSYMMTAGCNLAIESALYLECGGFPRTKIEDVHEDHVLINRVRLITASYQYLKSMHVEVSARRIDKWGIINTLKWYANHSYRPEVIDIR
jgi:glycosyltransferase involved in cell wall biosynthesis